MFGVGKALAELTAVLLGVGLIVGAFSATGLAGTLVNDLVFMAGNNVIVLLIMGALTAFVFGMGMTVTACYIFLAVVLAPALEQAGLNRVAVHLFILYWGMVSYITPPVALGAFAAATMAGSSPFRTGLEAMRLGGVIYIAPFFFVLNPALVGAGSPAEIALVLATALIGITFISGALQGHVSYVGGLGEGAIGIVMRVILFAAGLLFAAPGNETLGRYAHAAEPGRSRPRPAAADLRLDEAPRKVNREMQGGRQGYPLPMRTSRSIENASRPAYAPVAQLDRALPSEGRGQRFESSRVRQVLSITPDR